MHFRVLIILFLGFFTNDQLVGQETYTLSGYVRDSATAETLISANLYVQELETGMSTNEFGFFSLTIPKGSYTLTLSYVSYQTKVIQIELTEDLIRDFELSTEGFNLSTVVVEATKKNANVENMDISLVRLKVAQIKDLPSFFGEVDVLKSLQLLPGVESAEAGTAGLFVRGGSADQSLVRLDGATVYNPSHVLGFFSVFNVNAIKDVQLYKGGIPAKYGGRLSSVVNINMKEGNAKKFSASLGIGNIAAKATIEGPIVKEKASFIVSGRRTYIDILTSLSSDEEIRENKLFFYDLNAKVNWSVNKKNTFYLSGYFGKDFLGAGDFAIDWGNSTVSFRWNHLFSQKLFLNTTVLYSKFNYGFEITEPRQSFDWNSSIEEGSARLDFSYFPNPKNEIEFGGEIKGYHFSPTDIQPIGDASIFKGVTLTSQYAFEGSLYAQNRQKLSTQFSIEYGLRLGIFSNIGPGRSFVYSDPQNISEATLVDTVFHDNFDNIQSYLGLEPRIGLRYLINEKQSIKAFYNRLYQYIQVVSPSTATTPFDRWVPVNEYIRPQISDQIAFGYFRNFSNNKYEFSVELYHKWLRRQIDLKDGAEVFLTENIETEVLEGTGRAYGLEFLLRKNRGRTTGWLSYTYSKVKRTIPGINGGKAYSPRYDRPHNISIVGSYKIKPHMRISGTWRYNTGSAVTYPSGIYDLEGTRIPYYDPENRNADRMPDFHQMDVSFTFDGPMFNRKEKLAKPNRKFEVSRTLTLYNLYARKNAFSIRFQDVINGDPTILRNDPDVVVETQRPSAVKTYLLSIVPMINITIKLK